MTTTTRQGVFNSYIVGRIKVILLDTRFHRDPWPWHPGAKDPIETSDVLGEDQWEWLEKELTTILKNDIDLVYRQLNQDLAAEDRVGLIV